MKPHKIYKDELADCNKKIIFVARCIINDKYAIVAGCESERGYADYYIWNDKAPKIPLDRLFPNFRKFKFVYYGVCPYVGKRFDRAFPARLANHWSCEYRDGRPVYSVESPCILTDMLKDHNRRYVYNFKKILKRFLFK